MKRYEIGFIDGYDLRYKVRTYEAEDVAGAVEALLKEYGASFEHGIAYVKEA